MDHQGNMVSSSEYNRLRARKSRRFSARASRTEHVGTRVASTLFVLSCVALVGKAGFFQSGEISMAVERRGLDATENCTDFGGSDFCRFSQCEVPVGFGFTCCQANASNLNANTKCQTENGEVCTFNHLCKAELLPGGTGAAECLFEFELNNNSADGLLLHLFVLSYLFLALAIMVDDYFVSALDRIGEGLGLSEDVNGATFAAAGSSAPELFVSLSDNVISNPPKSLGIGTIIGSAIFNILVIIGLSAALAGQKLKIDWRPISRDSFFYAVSICGLIGVVYDGAVAWWEGLILVILYGSYILFMKYNQRFWDHMEDNHGWNPPFQADDDEEKVFSRVTSTNKLKNTQKTLSKQKSSGSKVEMVPRSRVGSFRGLDNLQVPEDEEGELVLLPYFDNLAWPIYVAEGESYLQQAFGHWDVMWRKRAYFLYVFPLNFCFRLTVPDSNYDIFREDKPGKPEDRKIGYWSSFVMCVLWIAVLSHFLVYSAAKFGCLAGIPAEVMGLTILAAGTSVPDAITSVIFARDGKGNMAIANSIGSNVFDILLGLGLPWFIAGLAFNSDVIVAVDGLLYSVIFLFGVLIFFLAATMLFRWQLDWRMGVLLLILYGVYVTLELLKVYTPLDLSL